MKKLIAVAVCIAVVAVWRARTHDAADSKLLFDRFWVDHPVRDIHERYQALYVQGEHPFGSFSTRTIWTGQWEAFHYHLIPREDGALDAVFPNTNEAQRVHYVSRSCTENGFDFCLEITGSSRGVKRYFSRKEWAGVSELRPSDM